MDVSALIDRLGGTADLAGKFGLSNKAVEMWGRRGSIPGRWHIPLLLLAQERGVPLSMADLFTDARGFDLTEARA